MHAKIRLVDYLKDGYAFNTPRILKGVFLKSNDSVLNFFSRKYKFRIDPSRPYHMERYYLTLGNQGALIKVSKEVIVGIDTVRMSFEK